MALFLFLLFPSQQAGSSQPAGREAAEQRVKQRASRQQAEQAKLEQGRPSQQAGRERASQRQPAQASCKRDAGAGVRVVCPCVKRFFAKREADVDGSA